jgi:tRNA(Ile)-lysidine synthase
MLKPVGRVGSRRLKKLLQEYGCPPGSGGAFPSSTTVNRWHWWPGSLSATDFWRQKRGGVGVAAPVTPDAD